MRVLTVAGVLAAGGAGAVLRHLVHVAFDRRGWPAFRGTLLVNATGSGLLGALVGLAATGAISTTTLTIAGTGFCGAFTTFSGFALAVVRAGDTNRRAGLRGAWTMVGWCAVAAAVGALLAGVR